MEPAHIELVERVALGGLLHDVGKFGQRAEFDPEGFRSFSNLGEFAQIEPSSGRISYHHAAYTWRFIEDCLPWLTRLTGPEGNVAQWAARHHNPRTVCDWIVAESDRLSAGMDRGHPDEILAGWAAVESRRLTPLPARIRFNAETFDATASQYELPLKALELTRGIFPQRAVQRSTDQGWREYRELFDSFVSAVAKIPQRDIKGFFPTFLSVYEQFVWCVPAATNSQPADISLFEHSRAAAAIAGRPYL